MIGKILTKALPLLGTSALPLTSVPTVLTVLAADRLRAQGYGQDGARNHFIPGLLSELLLCTHFVRAE